MEKKKKEFEAYNCRLIAQMKNEWTTWTGWEKKNHLHMSHKHVLRLRTMPYRTPETLSKGLPWMLCLEQSKWHKTVSTPAKNKTKRRRFIRSKNYTIWFNKYCSSLLFLLTWVFSHHITPALGQRLYKVVSENPSDKTNKLQQSFLMTTGK